MKTRYGFVSNSSTTSFCIYGIYTDAIFTDGEEEDDKFFERMEDFEAKCQEADLECYIDEGGGTWIGDSWHTIGDKETGKQFKDKVAKKVKGFFKQQQIEVMVPKFETHNETIAS